MKTVFDRVSDFEIIDFHIHPFDAESNICAYRNGIDMSEEDMISTLRASGISRAAGSVIITKGRERFNDVFDKQCAANRLALKMRDASGGFFIPGFHINPNFVKESIEEIEFMASEGVRLIGELVPYHDGWDSFSHEGLHPILEAAEHYGMAVSFHTMNADTIDAMVKAHPGVTFIAAHPGERDQLYGHIERMKRYDNLCLDISGTGLMRYHSLKLLVKELGSERILFGTDYPTCNPASYVGGVLMEMLPDSDLENIFSKNAKRILGL